MKVAVGLSGGVDSALAAALLVEHGYEVTGVFLECWSEPGCRTDQDRNDALKVALKLKIPFRVLNFKREYKQRILDEFYQEFRAGRTPNPDIACNREIKFGLFLDWAVKQGFDFVATGHYARAQRNFPLDSADEIFSCSQRSDRYQMRRCAGKNLPCRRRAIRLLLSADKNKDQTYFLALLKKKQLERVLFPIGNLTKKQVREEAKKRGLHVWNKKDSTGICLVGHDYSFAEFLKRKIKEHKGEIVDKSGKLIGQHQGVEFYTIGQRHGFTLTEKSTRRPRYFVLAKDMKNNRLIVGGKRDLAKKELTVAGWSLINPANLRRLSLKVRIRHQGKLIPCRIKGNKVYLKQAAEGVAPGQAAVIYCRQECLGGGIIS